MSAVTHWLESIWHGIRYSVCCAVTVCNFLCLVSRYCLCCKAAGQLQQLEEERISAMKDALCKYNSHLSTIGPKLIKVHCSCNSCSISVGSVSGSDTSVP